VKYNLKTPCKNCPFTTKDTRIVFSGTERATEIAEQAYRRGFPCHLSAAHDDDDEDGGYYDDGNAQHCAGALIMFIKDCGGGSPWPGIGNSERRLERLERQMKMDAPVFDSEEDFIEANDPKNWPKHMRAK
jgi:hypothetical protein